MSDTRSAHPRVGASPFSIGDPGRAGLELPAGRPGALVGQSDIEVSAATLPGVLIRAATIRGLLHRAGDEPRQDAFAIARHETGAGAWAVAVVCDGVGALGRSDEAATLAGRRLAELGAAGVPWPEAFAVVNEELHAYAEQVRAAGGGDASRDGMATTAVALSVHRDGPGWAGEVAWVGDSSLWHLDAAGRWTDLTDTREPGQEGDEDEGPFHSTKVRPMPSSGGSCATRAVRVSGGALFVMSDGIANPLDWCEDVRETLAKWWARPPDPFTFAAQAAFARKTHVDDRTVVALWPDDDDDQGDDEGHAGGGPETAG
ncbi:hypothetical protein Skr01_23950 [Sphaerisporangium krabiense]|uniref:PPM-type phosphatase domain-containing protein n=1 Tax=Sphaerisporangium krabiense TaxID=763782 RepID=A0A7W8Z608_9ACTN|nr:protein phosphatase 2C domain-containing protein [Sphaerisporangium krabiense]MBB5628141.1 hypothetical protein [Sphaerisporangium krabiense]GII62310.1 hypothetical protein Skr01_23950 [Sphaerisporangium krabiense]